VHSPAVLIVAKDLICFLVSFASHVNETCNFGHTGSDLDFREILLRQRNRVWSELSDSQDSRVHKWARSPRIDQGEKKLMAFLLIGDWIVVLNNCVQRADGQTCFPLLGNCTRQWTLLYHSIPCHLGTNLQGLRNRLCSHCSHQPHEDHCYIRRVALTRNSNRSRVRNSQEEKIADHCSANLQHWKENFAMSCWLSTNRLNTMQSQWNHQK
jgi:hypothetical protein